MKKMIDELWDGEISPQDTLISDNQEYRELQHRQSQNKAELLEALSDEQKELLEKFCATEIELNGISEREAFTAVFKIAMRLAAEGSVFPEFKYKIEVNDTGHFIVEKWESELKKSYRGDD